MRPLRQAQGRLLLAIVGPTAVGKSALALELAQRFGGEIVSADSRQVYRHLNIGTAKPSRQERTLVPHHLIDVVDPDEPFNLALYQRMAYRAIEGIQGRGMLPILVGGSGLYVWAVLEGWRVPEVAPNPAFRRSLEARAQREGVDALYKELEGMDPDAARSIHPHNLRRIVRALEVCLATRKPFSQLVGRAPPSFHSRIMGLTLERQELYRRIDARIEGMMRAGLVAEVKGLLAMGYSLDLPALSSLGYQQIGLYQRGRLSLEEAVQRFKAESHRFARHQYAWFRLDDQRIRWFVAGAEEVHAIEALCYAELAKK